MEDTDDPSWRFDQLLAAITEKDTDESNIVSASNALCELLHGCPALRAEIVAPLFTSRVAFMFGHPLAEVRALAFRLARYTIYCLDLLRILVRCKALVFIIVSLGRPTSPCERDNALKLIRAFLTIENGADCISIGVIKALVSLIEGSSIGDEQEPIGRETPIAPVPPSVPVPCQVKQVCIETLCEIALAKPRLLFHADALRVLLDTLANDLLPESGLACLLVVLSLLNRPDSRKLFRNGNDLMLLLSTYSLVENDVVSPQKLPKLKQTLAHLQRVAFFISVSVKHFVGLMCFSIENFTMLSFLVQLMQKRNCRLRQCIMDTVLDILLIEPLPACQEGTDLGDAIRRYNAARSIPTVFQYNACQSSSILERKVSPHYQGLVVLSLLKVGIFSRLSDIISEDSDVSNVKQACLLTTHIYHIASNYLPLELAGPFLAEAKVILSPQLPLSAQEKATQDAISRANLRAAVRTIAVRARSNVDDTEFKLQLFNTRVLTTKEYNDWNWQLILNLMHGPLRNPKRFSDTLERSPKFFKRIMLFYRPFKFRFSHTSHDSQLGGLFVLVGCEVLRLLLLSEQGVRYLQCNKLMPQIAEIFAQIDPYSGVSAHDAILSVNGIERNIGLGYVRFVGVLSTLTDGIDLLEQWQLLSILSNIVDASNESGKCDLVLVELLKLIDFTQDSPFRLLLQKVCLTSNARVRLFVARRLLPNLVRLPQCEQFVIRLMVQLMYDPNPEYAHQIVDGLVRFYTESEFEHIAFLISLEPAVSVLSQSVAGKNLLLHFLRDTKGFKYLYEHGFIDDEFSKWLHIEDFTLLALIERSINTQLFPYMPEDNSNELNISIDFFELLLLTPEGLHYFSGLKQRHFLDQHVTTIMAAVQETLIVDLGDNEGANLSVSKIRELKQSLWIIGCVASSTHGIELLDPYPAEQLLVVNAVLELFSTCAVWEVRGVCFYVAGLISRTSDGVEILDDNGWITVFDEYGRSKGLAYPRAYCPLSLTLPEVSPRGQRLASVSLKRAPDLAWEFEELVDQEYTFYDDQGEYGDYNLDTSIAKIINLIEHLNSVLSRIEWKAARELHKAKRARPEIFASPKLLLEVVGVVDKLNFRYQLRQFIFALFDDTKALENLAKRDKQRGRISSQVEGMTV